MDEGQPFGVIVDYAHTEDSLVRSSTRSGRLPQGGSSPFSDAAATGTGPSGRRWAPRR